MKNRLWKRIGAAALGLTLIGSLFTGCGKNEEQTTGDVIPKNMLYRILITAQYCWAFVF